MEGEKNIEEWECPICYKFMVEPAKLPCNHVFCYDCILEFQDTTSKCPMCRKEFPSNLDPVLDRKLQEKIKKEFPEEFEKTLKEYMAKRNSVRVFRLLIGNRHKLVEEAGQSTNKHDWTFFLAGKNFLVEKLVSSVDIELHPTFPNPKFKLAKAPFQFSRIGWGVFDIGVTVHFKEEFGLAPIKTSHYLSFSQPLTQRDLKVKVPKDKSHLLQAIEAQESV